MPDVKWRCNTDVKFQKAYDGLLNRNIDKWQGRTSVIIFTLHFIIVNKASRIYFLAMNQYSKYTLCSWIMWIQLLKSNIEPLRNYHSIDASENYVEQCYICISESRDFWRMITYHDRNKFHKLLTSWATILPEYYRWYQIACWTTITPIDC